MRGGTGRSSAAFGAIAIVGACPDEGVDARAAASSEGEVRWKSLSIFVVFEITAPIADGPRRDGSVMSRISTTGRAVEPLGRHLA